MWRRCLELPLLVLCSTDDPITKATWKSLGFVFTSEEDLKVGSCLLICRDPVDAPLNNTALAALPYDAVLTAARQMLQTSTTRCHSILNDASQGSVEHASRTHEARSAGPDFNVRILTLRPGLMEVTAGRQAWGIRHKDLLHMDNTVQMHKTVPSARRWRAITIKHDHWRQRTYVPVAAGAWMDGLAWALSCVCTRIAAAPFRRGIEHMSCARLPVRSRPA